MARKGGRSRSFPEISRRREEPVAKEAPALSASPGMSMVMQNTAHAPTAHGGDDRLLDWLKSDMEALAVEVKAVDSKLGRAVEEARLSALSKIEQTESTILRSIQDLRQEMSRQRVVDAQGSESRERVFADELRKVAEVATKAKAMGEEHLAKHGIGPDGETDPSRISLRVASMPAFLMAHPKSAVTLLLTIWSAASESARVWIKSLAIPLLRSFGVDLGGGRS